MPEAEAWYVKNGEHEPIGPVTTEQLVRGLQAGRVPRTSVVCRVGDVAWSALHAVPAFAPFGAAAEGSRDDAATVTGRVTPQIFAGSASPQQSPQPGLLVVAGPSQGAALGNAPMLESVQATKRCPFCSETILFDAIKCKHCQSDLRLQTGVVVASHPSATGEGLGTVMLTLPFAATILIWLWVGQMNLLQGPDSTLSVIGWGTIVATAALAAMEAHSVGAGSATDLDPKGRRRSGPIPWFALLVIMWILGFPMWLFQRSRYGLKNLVVGGVTVALAFATSWYLMGTAIESKRSELRHRFGALDESIYSATGSGAHG